MNSTARLGLAFTLVASLTASTRAQEGVVNTSLVGHWNEGFGAYADVWADGDHAYVGHHGHSHVEIIDISDPAQPVRVAEYQLPPPNESASAQDVKVGDGLLFISLEGGGNSVHIVDVRDPANPVGLVDIAIDGFTAIHNTFYHEGYLYMADSGTPRVGIVDLTTFNPNQPPLGAITEVKWMVDDVGSSFVHDVTVVGDRLYASAWDSGVWILDVSSVAGHPPQFLGSGPGNNTHSCWPTSDGAYVVTGEERPGGGITVYRITEDAPGSVTLEVTDAHALPPEETSSVHNQVTIGYRVFNSWYGAGLRVYDVDPDTGLLDFVAGYDTSETGSVWGVDPRLGPDRVLISSRTGGLFIIDVLAPIPGDVDADGVVGFADLLVLLANWGACAPPPADCPADVDGDGAVGFDDLLVLLAHWS